MFVAFGRQSPPDGVTLLLLIQFPRVFLFLLSKIDVSLSPNQHNFTTSLQLIVFFSFQFYMAIKNFKKRNWKLIY